MCFGGSDVGITSGLIAILLLGKTPTVLGGRHLGIEFQCRVIVSDGLIEAIESEVNEATAVHFGALAGILTPFFASQLRERTAQFENLTAYVDRMMLQYFPEFSWKSQREAA